MVEAAGTGLLMGTQVIAIQTNLTWLVAQDKRSHYWVAQCPPLQIVAEGETYAKLTEAIDACQQALFSELLETGELAGFLREHGWRLSSPLPASPTRVRFDIPYEIQRRSAHDFAEVPCY
jgi:predicted RNase H-like HicB family nuclease